MQTRLSAQQLARPDVARAEPILRSCVHCGFCNATCPTYALLGDELDGPRGRIYQIKSWLEEDRAPTASDAAHIDRCLSCLACVTACPSGVDYMHLVDFARAEIEASPARTGFERWTRALLRRVVTDVRIFRWAVRCGRLFRPLASFAPAHLRAMLDLLPDASDRSIPEHARALASATGPVRRRVALLRGCAQDELRPRINDAALRVLTRLGCEVCEISSASCCGAVAHHLGQAESARAAAVATAKVLKDRIERDGIDAIACTASGCGTMLKDYVQVLREVPGMEATARAIAARTRDLSELIRELDGAPLETVSQVGVRVAVHVPCSIYHGQGLGDPISPLLAAAGFATVSLPDAHLCCGSAGVYNVLQPQLARELRARKVELIRRSGATAVATGNIGCLLQLRAGLRDAGLDLPVVHAVELLDDPGAQKSE